MRLKQNLFHAATAFFLSTTGAWASSLFSIDVASDELVRIDSQSGSVQVVGAIEFNAIGTDLANVGSRLFALNSDFVNTTRIYELDPTNGSTISEATVELNGVPVGSAESLAAVNGILKIGFDLSGTINGSPDFMSEGLGDLGLDGSITNVVSGFPAPGGFQPEADFDALGASGNILYSGDSSDGRNDTEIYRVDAGTSSLHSVFHQQPTLGIVDMVVDDGQIIGIDFSTPQLHIIDIGTGTLTGSLELNRSGSYWGLTAVPLPPSWLALASGLSLLAFNAKARRRRNSE